MTAARRFERAQTRQTHTRLRPPHTTQAPVPLEEQPAPLILAVMEALPDGRTEKARRLLAHAVGALACVGVLLEHLEDQHPEVLEGLPDGVHQNMLMVLGRR
jgi:hypothetical protein